MYFDYLSEKGSHFSMSINFDATSPHPPKYLVISKISSLSNKITISKPCMFSLAPQVWLPLVKTDANLQITFKTFENSDHQTEDGECCDGSPPCSDDPCDIKFKICLDDSG